MNPAERIEVMLVDKNGELYSENGANVDDYGESLPNQKNAVCTSIRGINDCSLLKGERALKKKSFLLSKRWLDTLDIGSVVDSMDIQGRWYKSTVIKVDEEKNRLLIHFHGWRELYDEWIYRYSGKITMLGQKVKEGSDITSLLHISGQAADFTPVFVEGLNEYEKLLVDEFEEEQKERRIEMEKETMRRKKEKETKQKEKKKEMEKMKEKKRKEKKKTVNEPTKEKKQQTELEEIVDKLADLLQKGKKQNDKEPKEKKQQTEFEELVEKLNHIVDSEILDNDPGPDNTPVRSPPARLQNARRPKGSTPIKRWSQEQQQDTDNAKELKEYEKFLDNVRSGVVKKVDALDSQGDWWTGQVTILLTDSDEVNISFDEWRSVFDEFIPISSGKLAPRLSKAKGGKLKGGVPGAPLFPGKLKSKAKEK